MFPPPDTLLKFSLRGFMNPEPSVSGLQQFLSHNWTISVWGGGVVLPCEFPLNNSPVFKRPATKRWKCTISAELRPHEAFKMLISSPSQRSHGDIKVYICPRHSPVQLFIEPGPFKRKKAECPVRSADKGWVMSYWSVVTAAVGQSGSKPLLYFCTF